MKKFISTVAISLLAVSFAAAKNESLVSVDSILIMQKSKEGQLLTKKLQDEITTFQKEVALAQKEMGDLQKELTDNTAKFSKEQLELKSEELANKRKNLERKLADKEEKLKVNIQKEQITLRDKQMKVVNEEFEKQQWGLLIDKNTPGVLCVAKAIDKTEELLKKVDDSYSIEQTKNQIKAGSIKTAAAESKQNAEAARAA